MPEYGFLLFESTNTHRQKFYFLKHDPELLAYKLTDLEISRNHAIYNTIPPVPDGFNPQAKRDKACGFCDKKPLCAELSEGGVSYEDIREKDKELRG